MVFFFSRFFSVLVLEFIVESCDRSGGFFGIISGIFYFSGLYRIWVSVACSVVRELEDYSLFYMELLNYEVFVSYETD